MITFGTDGSFALDSIRGKPERPWVQWNHVDGPVLICCNGAMHWLTWKERFLIWIGKLKVEDLDPMWDEELFGEGQ